MRHPPRQLSGRAVWSLRLALFGLAVTLAGVATLRYNLFQNTQSLAVFACGLMIQAIALIVAVLAISSIWQSGALGIGKATGAIVLALMTLTPPALTLLMGLSYPPIHDISTDLIEPPAFSRSRTALAARADHVPEESPPDVHALQKQAYRDLTPIILDMGEEEAYALVLEAIAAEKWQIVDRAPPAGRSRTGRIDAVDQSLILRLKDDITIRIKPLTQETRVDIRSVSRLGRHDFGENAARIRRFSATLTKLAKG